jgi:hypothetical protein
MSDASDAKERDRHLFRRIGLWGTANAMRQHFALSGSTAAADLPQVGKLLDEVPFGGQVTINQQARPSALAKWAAPAVLAAGAGLGGFWLANQKPPEPPAPVDAVLEWEVSDSQKETITAH